MYSSIAIKPGNKMLHRPSCQYNIPDVMQSACKEQFLSAGFDEERYKSEAKSSSRDVKGSIEDSNASKKVIRYIT
jgi:hypothetical protein